MEVEAPRLRVTLDFEPHAFDQAGKFKVLNMPFFSLIQDFVLRNDF
jgi:hypothetical protein